MAAVAWIPRLAWWLLCRYPNEAIIATGAIVMARAMGVI